MPIDRLPEEVFTDDNAGHVLLKAYAASAHHKVAADPVERVLWGETMRRNRATFEAFKPTPQQLADYDALVDWYTAEPKKITRVVPTIYEGRVVLAFDEHGGFALSNPVKHAAEVLAGAYKIALGHDVMKPFLEHYEACGGGK